MANFRKIARRTFLVGSVAVAGGVAFGVYKWNETPDNPLSARPGAQPLNAFVIINQDGVTLITPKAEMGQGTQSTLAALVAEELDVDWQDIRTEHGPPAQAYFNSALFGLALPFMDYRVSDFQQRLRDVAGEGAKFLSLQLTGGSTSMKDGYERMRLAGATAREALKAAAAERLGIRASELKTQGGKVIAPDGTEIAYSDLAEEAAQIDPPRVELRDPSQWRYLRQSMPRLDIPSKVTGTAQYAIDTRLDGMRYVAIRRNPARAGMLGFDASEAENMPGVEQIVDIGDGVAVVATNTWLANQAADAIVFDWEPPAYPATTEGILEEIRAAFDTEPNSRIRDDGKAGDPHDGDRIEAEYSVPWLAHATMEPMTATAHFTGDRLKIWTGNQAPGLHQNAAAEAAGLQPDQVDVITPYMGGGFGRRGETDFTTIAARVAKAVPGVPVNVTFSREEDMAQDYYRPAAFARFSGVVRDGKAISLDGALAAPSVVNAASVRMGQEVSGTDRELVGGLADQPYRIQNYRITGHVAPTMVPFGYWRSVSASFNGFFHESFIDEMAHAAGRDPLEFRLELMRDEHAPSAKVMEALREMSGGLQNTPDGVGRGVAFTHSFGTATAQMVEVVQTDAGIKLNKVWIACDPGIALDPANIEAQMTGGCLFGLSAAVMGEIHFEDGAVVEQNFWDYDALRMNNAPRFEVAILENAPHLGGIGEPGTPPAAAALANALFDLTGIRARDLPLNRTFEFAL